MDHKPYRSSSSSAEAVKPEVVVGPKSASPFSASLAKVYGWVALGLLTTAIVSFCLALVFAHFFGPVLVPDGATEAQKQAASRATTIYLIVFLVSIVLLFLSSGIFNLMLARRSKKAVVPYFLYAGLMGVMFSSLLLIGIDFYAMGVAFAITALSFGLLSLWGIKSKKNLNIIGMVALALLSSVLLSFLFFLIIGLMTGNGLVFATYDFIMAFVIDLVVAVTCAVDSYNMRNSLAANPGDAVVEAAWAFRMYVDFIWLLMRVVLLLASLSRKRN